MGITINARDAEFYNSVLVREKGFRYQVLRYNNIIIDYKCLSLIFFYCT